MSYFAYDIETGSRPWEEIKDLYVAPPKMPPWTDEMVKYGRLTDPAKRAEKLAETKAKYIEDLANEARMVEEDRCRWASEAALSPVTGVVLAIGIRRGDENYILGSAGESEAEILQAWWKIFAKHQGASKFVGFCSNFFDLPFLQWRSYVHGIAVPQAAWDKTGKWPGYAFVDLMDRVPKRGLPEDENGKKRGLSNVCRLLGLGQKPEGLDGGMFASLWTAGTDESRAQAIDYLLNDLDMTWKLAERMGVVQ